MSDSELTLEQWKNKFKNANMDKSEAMFRESRALTRIKKLENELNETHARVHLLND